MNRRFGKFSVMVALAAMGVSQACNCDENLGVGLRTTAEITLGDAGGGAKKLDGAEGTMDFGVVLADQPDGQRELKLAFENVGSTPIQYASCSSCEIALYEDKAFKNPYSGDEFAFGTTPFKELGTAAGETKGSFTVIFAPTTVGKRVAYLKIVSDDSERPEVVIELVGRGVKPEIEVCRAESDGSIVKDAKGKEECYPAIKPKSAAKEGAAGGADGGVASEEEGEEDEEAEEEIPVALVLSFGETQLQDEADGYDETRYFVVRSAAGSVKEGGSSSFLLFDRIYLNAASKYLSVGPASDSEAIEKDVKGPANGKNLMGLKGCYLAPDSKKIKSDLGVDVKDLETYGLKPKTAETCVSAKANDEVLFAVNLAYKFDEAEDPGRRGANATAEIVFSTDKIQGDASDPKVKVVVAGFVAPKGYVAPPAPGICTDTPLVDFGGSVVGAPAAPKQIQVCSCGVEDLVVSALEVTGPVAGNFVIDNVVKTTAGGASEPVSDFAEPVTLKPAAYQDADGKKTPTNAQQCLVITMTYTPDKIGSDKADLEAPSNDPKYSADAPFKITLTGRGTEAAACDLRINPPATMTVGNALEGQGRVSNDLALVNIGTADCTVTEVTPPATAKFGLVNPPTVPFTVAAGGNQLITVDFGCDAGEAGQQFKDKMAVKEASTPVQEIALVGSCMQKGQCNLTVIPQVNPTTGLGTLNFGNVAIGGSKSLPIILSNQPPLSGDNCTLNKATLNAGTDPSFSLVPPVPAPGTQIPFGSQLNVNVKFSPMGAGFPTPLGLPCTGATCKNFVCLDTTSVSQPQGCGTSNPFGGGTKAPGYRVNLNGVGTRSQCEVIPRELDFGVVTLGCASQNVPVTLYNNGSGPFQITAMSTQSPPTFQIVGTAPAGGLPLTVNAGQSVQVIVRYIPQKAGAESGKLLLTLDASNGGNCSEIPLIGEGTTETTVTDIFYQFDDPVVDVLWCADNSGSMDEEQRAVGQNFGEFVTYATSVNANYQIGVISSEINDANEPGAKPGIAPGYLWSQSGFPKIVRPSTPNPSAALAANIQVGTCCSDEAEACLEASKLALDTPNIDDPNINQGFLREEAKLVLIMLSDEEDQSPGSVAFYVDFFRNIHGPRNLELLSASIIVGLDPSTLRPAACQATGTGAADAAHRYYDFYQQINNGVAESICAPNWGTKMRNLALDAFVARVQYPLSRGANPNSMRVFVNGIEVKRHPKDGWDYDEPLNSIVFGENAVPPKAAQIEVTYEAICIKP